MHGELQVSSLVSRWLSPRCRLLRRTRSKSASSQSASLPYFVALELGFFKEQNIEPEMVRLIGGPPNVAAMITNQIDAAAVLVTIEGMNANIKKPGVAMYISINSQNKTYQMEQFVIRKGLEAKTLADLKGKKIMSAPGPANVTMAKAALAAAGLKEGEYTLDQLDMGQHVNAMTAGTFDAGYTLEPNASTMRKMGVATTLEAGVIAHYVPVSYTHLTLPTIYSV